MEEIFEIIDEVDAEEDEYLNQERRSGVQAKSQ